MNILRIPFVLALLLCTATASAATRGNGDKPANQKAPAETGYNQEGFGLPALFVLQYPDAPRDYPGRRVRMVAGELALDHALPSQSVWYILPGTVLRPHQKPPTAIQVRLYTGKGTDRRLLCTVDVRYYGVPRRGWQPWYVLDSEMNGIWSNNEFRPFNPTIEERPLLYRDNTTLPNGDGYFPSLKLKSSAGPVTIDSWTVTTPQP